MHEKRIGYMNRKLGRVCFIITQSSLAIITKINHLTTF